MVKCGKPETVIVKESESKWVLKPETVKESEQRWGLRPETVTESVRNNGMAMYTKHPPVGPQVAV